MLVPGHAHVSHLSRYVGVPLLILFCWDVLVTAAWYCTQAGWDNFPALPLTLFGTAVAIYLSFRNATAYARWWEARTLWGAMVNCSRTLVRDAWTLLGDARVAREISYRQIAYVHALRLHLRRQKERDELVGLLSEEELADLDTVANAPNAIALRTGALLSDAAPDSIIRAAFARTLAEISNAQGGMERIKNTPLPQQYSVYPVVFTHLFCALLPFGLVEQLGLYTPLGSTVAGVLFLGLLQSGNDLQDPFENGVNDVPMTAVTRGIEIDLRDGMREDHRLKPFPIEAGVLK
ncbi:bestrophin family ion channel [Luteibacter sp. ME-Dv--P-043b]|uniref:bestrophin family protein n=1 Tax=unclassified Luteibacter TaxID=2620188 RepID=UPI0025536E42|nr:bestrophin family ion channel [Luteibacter sp. ME-Dv--P-043b]